MLLYQNDDYAVRLSGGSAWLTEWWHTAATNELGFAIACAVIVALMLVVAERKKQAIARELSFVGNWCVGFINSAWEMFASRFEGEAMRKKKQEEFSKRIQNVLIHMIDTAVEKNGITQTMANVELKRLARAYPELRHCIWHPVDTKEAVVERRLNQDRDVNGNVIPLPLP